MQTHELRELDKVSLEQRASSLRAQLADLQEAIMSGKEKNHAQLRFLRRDIARVHTLLRELTEKA